MSYRLGVDIGGTFTDLVIQRDDGRIHTVKVPTTPEDPSQAVLNAIEIATGAEIGITPADVTQLIHSTTIATNTILQGKGARTGFLVTEGFRDLLDIRRHKRYSLFDASYRKLPPLVERRLTFGIPERIDAQGEVVQPLDEQGCVMRYGRSRPKASKPLRSATCLASATVRTRSAPSRSPVR